MRLRRLSILNSFAYQHPVLDDTLLALSPYCRVLIDSGAYTNHVALRRRISGRPEPSRVVDLPSYMQHVRQVYHGNVWRYISFDRVRNPEETYRNYQVMCDAGLTPMPVCTEGTTLEQIQQMLPTDRRLCVSGGVTGNDHYIRLRYQTIYEGVEPHPLIHGLGFGRWPDIFHVPLASGDSSSWCQGAQYGLMCEYRPSVGFIRANKVELAGKPKFIAYLRHTCHVPPHLIGQPDTYRKQYGIPSLSSVYSYLAFMHHLAIHGKDFFLAMTNVCWMLCLLCTLSAIDQDGFDYLTAVEEYHRLNAAAKAGKLPEEAVKIVRRQTDCFTGDFAECTL